MSVDLRLSADIELGGKTIPLTSPPIDQIIGTANKTKKDVKLALHNALKRGISFGLPPGTEVSVQLQEIIDFVSKGLKSGSFIPGIKEISEFFDSETTVTEGSVSDKLLKAHIKISAFQVNTKGAFSIAIEFIFDEDGAIGILAKGFDTDVLNDLKDVFNIESIGLAFDWVKDEKEKEIPKKDD